jgi:hypothetical protein
MEKKLCEKCFKEIKKNEDYFELLFYSKGKIANRTFMHKKCKDNMNKDQLSLAKGIASSIPGLLKQIGIEPIQEFEIQ